ncbi:MAG: tetratricopeptide repeat protein [Mesoflavibacter sp.]|nr:tetratricopeptide repeat protein [Mesoflavibacter sp.]
MQDLTPAYYDPRLLNESGPAFSSEFQLDIGDLVNELAQRFMLSGEFMMHLARWLQKQNLWEEALSKYQKSLALGYVFPQMYMTMGQCHKALGDNIQALHCYNVAIEKNPQNPSFYNEKASLLIQQGNSEQALPLLDKAYRLAPNAVGIVLAYANELEQQGQTTKALDIVNLFLQTQTNPAINNMKIRLKLKNNLEEGQASYLQLVKADLVGKDKFAWLAKATAHISNVKAEADFLARVEKHWQSL